MVGYTFYERLMLLSKFVFNAVRTGIQKRRHGPARWGNFCRSSGRGVPWYVVKLANRASPTRRAGLPPSESCRGRYDVCVCCLLFLDEYNNDVNWTRSAKTANTAKGAIYK